MDWIRRKLKKNSNCVRDELTTTEAAFGLLCEGKSGWFQISLTGVDHKLFAEPPASSSSSVSLPFRSEQKLEERSLLIPATPAAYRHWLDEVMFRFERKMSM